MNNADHGFRAAQTSFDFFGSLRRKIRFIDRQKNFQSK
jgi:hypothetical protein